MFRGSGFNRIVLAAVVLCGCVLTISARAQQQEPEDPEDDKKPPYYLANQGDVVCLCNMDDAMLDLPVASPKALDAREWEANTDRIPPPDTKVDVIFDIVPEKKDK